MRTLSQSCLLSVIAAVTLSLMSGCGGGSSETAAVAAPEAIPRVHAPASLKITSANAQHVAAHVYFAFKAMNGFLTSFPVVLTLSGASALAPSGRMNCGLGYIDVNFHDNDQDGRTSVGDTVVYSSPDCGFPSSYDGLMAVMTVRAVESAEITSAKLDVTANGYDTLFPYGLRATFSGSFLLDRFQGKGQVLKSIGSVLFQSTPTQSLEISNLAISFVPREVYGSWSDISMDIVLSTSMANGLRVQVENVDGPLAIFGGYNEAPHPSRIVITGDRSTKVSLSSLTDTVTFKVDVDSTGSGTVEAASATDAERLFGSI